MKYSWLGHAWYVECIVFLNQCKVALNGYALKRFYESCSNALNGCIWRVWETDCISIGANVVMHCMNALRWVHVMLWITNGWNDELMTIQELFQRLLWMQDSKCMKRVVMIDWLPEVLHGNARQYNDMLVK